MIVNMKLLVSIFLVLLTCSSYAQLTRKEKKAARRGTAVDQPTTLDPGNENDVVAAPERATRHKEKKFKGPTHNAQKEFEQRMAARSKTYRRNERMLMTPQYSNPAYFGHKRKPKKHAANKIRYCKECGIRH